MTEFVCRIQGCSEAAKVGGMCVKHACEKAKENKGSLVNAKCEVCGNPLSINGICRSCAVKAGKERKKTESPKEDEKQEVAIEEPQVKIPESLLKKPSYAIEVDFTDFPALHETLIKMAKEELRTPNMQLLYLLRNELARLEEIKTA